MSFLNFQIIKFPSVSKAFRFSNIQIFTYVTIIYRYYSFNDIASGQLLRTLSLSLSLSVFHRILIN